MTAQEEFQLEQFKALRKEIETNAEEIHTLQRYAVVAIGAVWSWIATHGKTAAWIGFIPPAVIALGAWQSLRLLEEVQVIGHFIAQRVEPFFLAGAAGHGWESWLGAESEVARKQSKLVRDPNVWVVWAVLLAGSLLAAVLYQTGTLHV